MTKAKVKKKNSARTAQSIKARIVEVSLQHPELGARRLVPLLKKQRITVPLTAVQSILRREGLQNREKRLAKVKKPVQKPESQPKKPAARIPDKTGKRIVELALQNPELGAGRLVVELEKEKIDVSASSVHRILKRNGLEAREKRMAKLQSQAKKTRKRQSALQKTRRPKPVPKKPAAPIGDDAAVRIVEISLQNPDFGAGRLVPLLEREGIFASAAAVYRILRRRGLQTRERRLVKSAESVAEPLAIPKKFPEKIPAEVEDRMVELSLQNPDFGARRLIPLLQQEGIEASASAVYTILKRYGLENRQKRLLRLEDQGTPEIPFELETDVPESPAEPADIKPTPTVDEVPATAFEPSVAVTVPPEIEAPEPKGEPEPHAEPALVEPAQPERPPVRKTLIPPLKKRSHWVFYPLYLLLLLLIGYLGFNAVQTIQYARLGTEALPTGSSIPVGVAAKADASAQPLDGYYRIWERNLFNIARAKDAEYDDKISLDKIALAKKDLGLELVGTVVADDPQWSRAIIDNRKTRDQEAYREGDKAGEVRIKKILRNNVVITTAEGDELLTIEIKESGKSVNSSTYAQQTSAISMSSLSTPGGRLPVDNPWYFSLERQEVEASLANTQPLLQEVNIDPYLKADEPAGFKISNIASESVLRKIGLDNDDVISGLNEEAVTGPEQAADFFQRIAEGGLFKITIERNRRLRFISLNIQ